MLLSDMIGADGGGGGGFGGMWGGGGGAEAEGEDAIAAKASPLHGTQLTAQLRGFLAEFSAQQGDAMRALVALMPPNDQRALAAHGSATGAREAK